MRHNFLALSLIATLSLISAVCGAVESTHEPSIRGPVFVAVVFPVLELNQDRMDTVETIPDAYSFWGRQIISMTTQKQYFPAPLSYPYRYSKGGLIALQQELKRNPDVESSSVQVKSFPNIPQEQQYLYEPWELKQVLIKEAYVSFQLKHWNDIEFMAFPTFVVLAFDYTKGRINSNRDYLELKKRFSSIIEEFHNKERLQRTLGISRQRQKWAAVPVLAFTALDSYEQNILHKIYLNGDIEPAEARRIFLQQVSIRDYSNGLDASDPAVTQCNEIGHELSMVSQWRFYYAAIPLFYDRRFGQRMDIFPWYGPRGKQLRILRSALFINVTLPSLIKQSQELAANVNHTLRTIRDTRMRLFNEFTDKINDLTVPISKAVTALESRIEPLLARFQEAEAGYNDLVARIPFAFIPPPKTPLIKAAQNEQEDICLRLFYFNERGVTLSDRQKANSYVEELKKNIVSIQRDKERLSNEVSSALGFLETRRSLIWSRDNTKSSIDVARFNTSLTMVSSAVIALIFFVLGQLFSKSRFFEKRRRRKQIESNRNQAEEM